MLPFDGPRFYSRGACQHLMRFGLVTWASIPYTFSSTAHLPPDFFVEPLKAIEDTCSLAKQAINGLLGVWSIDTHHSWIVSTQKDEYHTLPYEDKLLVRPGAPGGGGPRRRRRRRRRPFKRLRALAPFGSSENLYLQGPEEPWVYGSGYHLINPSIGLNMFFTEFGSCRSF